MKTVKFIFLLPLLFIFILLFFIVRGLLQESKSIENTPDRKVISEVGSKEIGFENLTLSIDKIFSPDHTWTEILTPDKKRVLIATGDVLLARSVNYKTVTTGNFIRPFEKTAQILRNADITYINLETPLVEGCPLTNDGMIFCGDPRNIEGLLFGGVDVVNLANNHTGNYGSEGMENTAKLLTNAGLLVSGITGPVYKDIRGVKFAFLGYDQVNFRENVSPSDREKITGEIKDAKSNAEIVIVQFHWGNEYTTIITPLQKELAHLAIDGGGTLVIGNHPHWIQPVEIYKGKLIIYAHGNFIFDQEWSRETKLGVAGKYTFYEDKLIDAEFLPVEIKEYGQPDFLSGDDKKQIIEMMKLQSHELASKSL